jgi:hypothetical protein
MKILSKKIGSADMQLPGSGVILKCAIIAENWVQGEILLDLNRPAQID